MYRFVEEVTADGEREKKICGVLTDYDLSSWTKSLNPDYTKTSQQRTGTPPYMANELLKGTSPIHLYRHDVESLFYIMLLMSAHHTIGIPENAEKPQVVVRKSAMLPYREWFNTRNYRMLGSLKGTFFSDMEDIELSPIFEDFRPWLKLLQRHFSIGFRLKPPPDDKGFSLSWVDIMPTADQFDNETLGGYINYATVVGPVPYLAGELKGLVIRNPSGPSAPGPSTSAGAAQIDK